MFAGEIHDHNVTDKICLECNREFTGIMTVCPHDNSMLIQKMQDPWIGTTLAGTYDIISVAGHGGMGVVYKARHSLMDRIVAIKMLQAGLIADSMSFKRFQQEGKAASRIRHEHVITVYDFGISPTGQPYIVMDFLEGHSLADEIKRLGQVSVERTIKIISQSCDALSHAHKQGVVHRDLKPTNIVLTTKDDEEDFVKVVDFGVAMLMPGAAGAEGQRLTQAGEVCGSPVYMSPEQCMGLDLDPRSDIYSMGVVLYETLTGKLPILGKTMVDTMSKHISDMPPPLSEARPDLYIPERLEMVIFRALAKKPEDRHQSMVDLMQDLEMAIPRPGRSQVLRTAEPAKAPIVQAGETLKGVPVKAWVLTALCVLALGTAGIAAIRMFVNKGPTNVAPVPIPRANTSNPAHSAAPNNASAPAPQAPITAPAAGDGTTSATTPTAVSAPASPKPVSQAPANPPSPVPNPARDAAAPNTVKQTAQATAAKETQPHSPRTAAVKHHTPPREAKEDSSEHRSRYGSKPGVVRTRSAYSAASSVSPPPAHKSSDKQWDSIWALKHKLESE